MLFGRKKIPCYVLVFDQVEIIQRTLDFLTKYSDRLDIVVLENPSANTSEIKRYVDKLGKAGLVKRYYLFDENITSNAYTLAVERELDMVRRSQYVVVTDGDVVVENTDWLKEEKRILQKHPEVFACGVTLDEVNLPLATFPESKGWVPPDINTYPDFFEARTGGHLLLMRGEEFGAFMDLRKERNLHFVDGDLHWFCYDILHKKWARTKTAKARHLTWDLYHDKNHPYTKLKTNVSFKDTWHHHREASYKLTDYEK